jgi:hypothetical protein
MRNRVKNLLLTFVLSATSVFGQSSPAEVIENSLKAIGGSKDLSEIRSIHAVADCTGPNGNYSTEIFSAHDGRMVFRQVRQNGTVYYGQTNGQTFWTKDETTGKFSFADKRAAAVWRGHDFARLAAEVAERFRDFTFAGDEKFADKTALKLRAVDELGNPVEIFFDKGTKLILGLTTQNPFSEQPELVRTVINEWKRVGNVKLPSKVTATDKKGDWVLNFREISLNKTDAKIFGVPAQVAAMIELFELHKQQRVAHFNRDAKLLISSFADDFTEVKNGRINKPTREAGLKRFQKYVDNSTFIEWDDITPPVIRVSADATIGYALVHKKVRLKAKQENGTEVEETEIFAWVAVYQKIKGEWKLVLVASTNTPEKD